MNYYAKRFFGQQSIVTDGLKLWLDASNPASYPGSGTTWYDLSGNANNGTLVNGVAYSTANGGVMSFDGVNDYVRLPSTTVFIDRFQPFTLSAWVNLTNFQQAFPTVFGIRSISEYYQLFLSNSAGYLGVVFGSDNANWGRFRSNTPASSIVGKNINIVLIYNGLGGTNINNFTLYLNNVNTPLWTSGQFASVSNATNIIGANTTLRLDCYFKGFINEPLIYNRALTPEEVLQNFNATKHKYGL